MGITAVSGPQVVFGITTNSTGQIQEYNEERGPSLYDLGSGVMDPRYNFSYMPGAAVGSRVFGFLNNAAMVDYVPTTLQTSAIALSTAQTLVSGAALTLTAAASGVGTYLTTIIAPETGQTSENLIAIDSTAQYLAFGQSGTVAVWNPAAGAGRQLTLTTAGNSSLDGGSWAISGRDVYGFKVSETISVSSQTMTTRKTFKYVGSILAATTLGSTGIRVGFNDTFGLPLLASNSGMGLQIRLIPTSSLQYQNSSGPITQGSTATQAATSSDPRGTYASTTASNGTLRLQIIQQITPAMVSSITASDYSPMFGATQYST